MIGSLLSLSVAAAVQPQPCSPERRAVDPRILIVFAPDRRDPDLREQQRLVREGCAALADRDVHLIEVVGDTVAGAHEYATALRQRYAVPAGRFGVLLVGRDGGVKLRSDRRIEIAELSRTIDAMPMRRHEMRVR